MSCTDLLVGQENPISSSSRKSTNITEKEKQTNWQALYLLTEYSVGILAAYFIMPLTNTLNTVILARQEDEIALESFGLALSIVTLAIESTTGSFASVLVTLVSQAFGAKDHELCGIYLNRQYFLNSVLYLLLCMPVLRVEGFLVSTIGQSPQVAASAKDACRILMIGAYF